MGLFGKIKDGGPVVREQAAELHWDTEDNVIDFINYPKRIFTIGRLDKESEGLLLLTNDGDLANKIMRSRYGHEKEYVVSLDRDVTPEFIKGMVSSHRTGCGGEPISEE